MADSPRISEFGQFVATALGARGGDGTQQPTAAVGIICGQQGLYIAKQGGPVPESIRGKLEGQWSWGDNFVDADSFIESRYLARTQRKLSEWTSYHAEMVILSAMLSANSISATSIAEVKAQLASRGGAYICANATACHHCGSMMDALGIQYCGAKGKKSLTGWWNPLTDRVYPQSDSEFAKDVPGV